MINQKLSRLTLILTILLMLCLFLTGGVFWSLQKRKPENPGDTFPAVGSNKESASEAAPDREDPQNPSQSLAMPADSPKDLRTWLGLDAISKIITGNSSDQFTESSSDDSPDRQEEATTDKSPDKPVEASAVPVSGQEQASAPDAASAGGQQDISGAVSPADSVPAAAPAKQEGSSAAAGTAAEAPAKQEGSSAAAAPANQKESSSVAAASTTPAAPAASEKKEASADATTPAASSEKKEASADATTAPASSDQKEASAAATTPAAASEKKESSAASASASKQEKASSTAAAAKEKTAAEKTGAASEKDKTATAKTDMASEKEKAAAGKTDTASEKEKAEKGKNNTASEKTQKTDDSGKKETNEKKDTNKTVVSGKKKEKKKESDNPWDYMTKTQKKYVQAWEDFHGWPFPLNSSLHNYNWDYLSYDESGLLHYEGDDNYTIRRGIDVSEFQGQIDWEAVRKQGFDFVFVRVGHRMFESGELMRDNRAIKNLTRAEKAGFDIGVYVFSQAITEEEAREEAQLCLDVIEESGVEITLPVVFDPEIQVEYYARINYISREQFTDNAVAFCKKIEKAGFTPAIYANCSTETDILDMSRLDGNALVWYADYNGTPESPYQFTFWQYTNYFWVDGIPETPTDLNVWFIEKE